MNKCVIVIPVYKEEPDSIEIASIVQAKKILSNHDIKLVCPEDLDILNYSKLGNFETVRFDAKYFKNEWSYCKLLLNKEFYKQFAQYQYMLLYQPDAWVFEDRVQEWCDKGYDYIGAPWFEQYGAADNKAKMFKYAGNGGFSLRNIQTFINMLSDAEKSNRKLRNICQIYTKEGHIPAWNILKIPKAIIKYFSRGNILKIAIKEADLHEDNVIVNDLRKIYPYLKVAKAQDAKYFAFEVNPSILYEQCGNRLPFGCHGFERYDWDFWQKYINLDLEKV